MLSLFTGAAVFLFFSVIVRAVIYLKFARAGVLIELFKGTSLFTAGDFLFIRLYLRRDELPEFGKFLATLYFFLTSCALTLMASLLIYIIYNN